MELEINGKAVTLEFGLDFIEFLDNKHKINRDGVEFATGVSTALIYLQQGNPRILLDLIRAGLITSKTKIGESEIKKFIESQEDLEKMFNDFFTKLEQSPMTKMQVKRLKAANKQAEA